MRIALLAHIRQPIAEPFMGGMESHSWHLADGLVRRGHDVVLFASGDSDPRFAIDPVLDQHYERTFPWAEHKGSAPLIAHVDAVQPGAVHRVQHEALLDDPETEIRALLAHCRLDFEPACLTPHETERAVRTASSEQVRRPFTKAAVGGWHRFAAHLLPLERALGDLAA